MQEDVFPAAEKILSDIENIFKKNVNLYSFEIIPAEDNENKSPVFHKENSLGLASWCIQPLYCYAYNRLLDLRKNEHRREEPTTISRWLLGTLLLNPNISTFWNMRREFIRNGRLDPMEELRFVNVVLFYRPKCFEAFSYRRWILKLILIENKDVTRDTELLIRNEIQIAAMAADRYMNNCYAWSHREHVVSMFIELESSFNREFNALLDAEWEESTRWCNCHVSDYSGFAYRQFLLKRLLLRKHIGKELNSCSDILSKRREIILEFVKIATRGCNDVFLLHDGSNEEVLNLLHGVNGMKYPEVKFEQTLINLSYWAEDCMINEELINTFPGHEALWYHRRFLAYSLRALNNSYTNFFLYKHDSLNPLQAMKTFNNNSKNIDSKSNSTIDSLLEIAFSSRNKELIDAAKRHGKHQNYLAEKFINFLIPMKLEP